MKIVITIIAGLVGVILIGFLAPERITTPVSGASKKDWNEKSFWYEPWGSSGVHKGIDIFGKIGTGIQSTTDGIVLYKGKLPKGGNVIWVLGPKWHFHYFAHLNTIDTSFLRFVKSGKKIGTLGDSGNARGTPPHLHYSIIRLIPVPWAIDSSSQGFLKAFYINPDLYLREKT